ncbi:MAG: DUF2273 domain-containing protein [Clostridia bacterium]|nr:DUF2273 domain-containing protein [Clostridia bacterium]
MKDFFKTLLIEHKWLLLFVFVALIIGVLILTINFWRTLLILLLVAIAAIFGYLMDRGGIENVKAMFARIFSRRSKL